MDALWNGIFADPVLLGRYPEGFLEAMPGPVAEDLAVIRQPLDFYGLNYYNPMLLAAPAEGAELPVEQRQIADVPTTDFGWPIVPDGLREVLVQMKTRYPDVPPIVITENGCSYAVGPDADGVVDDQARIDYLDAHLRAVGQAIEEGVDVAGYYCWSLLDNFEWAEGYTQRFGLVYVDYETQQRYPKRSFDWYAATIRANRR
jgi:beta-glucosidase